MPRSCDVLGCPNGSRRLAKGSSAAVSNVIYHWVPEKEPRHSEWLSAVPIRHCGRNESRRLVVCSLHFRPVDYEVSASLSKSLGLARRPVLSRSAVPSILPDCFDKQTVKPKDPIVTVSFHKFPRDKMMFRKWIVAIRRDPGPNFVVGQFTRVCSKHFKLDDYIPNVASGRRFLKENAVPTQFMFAKPVKQHRPPKERAVHCSKSLTSHLLQAASPNTDMSRDECNSDQDMASEPSQQSEDAGRPAKGRAMQNTAADVATLTGARDVENQSKFPESLSMKIGRCTRRAKQVQCCLLTTSASIGWDSNFIWDQIGIKSTKEFK
ncbi:uncharacterized protein [Dermacentor andersoni]|uniref:uncharacterized protein isoform X2 n=1 Tax=Dermacentor andersoni TaxID=34620 RepID=UPI00241725B5|nr:uncharacterized protein LOC126540213 isoform X3 [Dermacentor andersoni]